jgi:5,10-methylene-tetrahydrofolate dehydrogenase/methenyl tetrahydrofolate cyclohydrolase
MPNHSIAIVIAGGLIAAALLAFLMVDRYQIVNAGTVDGRPALFRLDERNGSVTVCLLMTDRHPRTTDLVDQYFVQCRE